MLREPAGPYAFPSNWGFSLTAAEFFMAETERRAWVRFRSEQDVACNTEEANTGWLGRVRNISCSGIALLLRRRFEPGTDLNIELETKAGWPRRLSVRVIHATQDSNDRWIIGCAFATPLSREELQDFFTE
jgi:hypothetical protein